jgi:hypothetical protein
VTAERVIRMTVRAYYGGKQEQSDTYRLLMSDGWNTWRPFDESEAVHWAVKTLSGHSRNPGSRSPDFEAFRPSRPGTDGSPRDLHYVDVDSIDIEESSPYDQGTFTLRQEMSHADDLVWIKRAWLETGFTAAERRKIYAALRRIRVAKEWFWHEDDPWLDSLMAFSSGDPTGLDPIDTSGVGKSLDILESGQLPGW